ncbi:hypothetical protein ABU162_22070 [Paenibacillus thiaminolyticus]|uniref:hypothetical protein n=1 Tax=Paenibacillus thiaminolyticus TaxID=49283 RepID=UPI0035A6BA61
MYRPEGSGFMFMHGSAAFFGSTGGVSDGNFTAACGTLTLDGIGVGGGGAHSPSEFI